MTQPISTCPVCGLSKDLCTCDTVAREQQKIVIKTVKRKFGKLMTIIEGLDKEVDIKTLAKQLKSKLACGGTSKDNVIELQGDHRSRVKVALAELGFPEDNIEIKEGISR